MEEGLKEAAHQRVLFGLLLNVLDRERGPSVSVQLCRLEQPLQDFLLARDPELVLNHVGSEQQLNLVSRQHFLLLHVVQHHPLLRPHQLQPEIKLLREGAVLQRCEFGHKHKVRRVLSLKSEQVVCEPIHDNQFFFIETRGYWGLYLHVLDMFLDFRGEFLAALSQHIFAEKKLHV